MTDTDLTQHNTLPKLLAHNARTHPTGVAMREKEFGIWRATTWADYRDEVRHLALALADMGVGKDHVVAMIGDNRPAWVFGELAAHTVGAMSLGIYRDALAEEVAYLITYTGATLIFAEDEEQVDKFLSLEDRIPTVRHIVYADPRGMRKYDDPRLVPLKDLIDRGEDLHGQHPERFDGMVAATQPDDVCILCTTSGTTANPKLAMLTHGALIGHTVRYLEVDPRTDQDEYVSVLPLPWIMEQIYCVAEGLITRLRVNFVEEPETQTNDLREIGPTFLLLAPRSWEQLAADVRARVFESSRLNQWIFNRCVAMGVGAFKAGKRSLIAEYLLFRWLRDRMGFARLRSAATGGAAMGPDTFNFFSALGVPLRQLYGQTELLGAYTVHTSDGIDPETVGVPFRDVDCRIENPDAEGLGEIVTRHPFMMAGYFKNEEATRETFDEEGWMHTGDAGYFNPQGHLVVIDRVKDLATTAQGIRFSPQYIENKLKFSTYIAESVVLGAGRDYLASMICIRYSIVSKWAEKQRIAFTTYSDLSARDEVRALIRDEVEEVNRHLPEHQRIRKFVLLYKELDADDGELTRTRKVRRGVIGEKYGEIIDTLYSDAKTIPIDTVIQFQDGGSQRVRTTLTVERLAAPDPAPAAAAPAGPTHDSKAA